MFKRVKWFVAGAAVGASGSVYARRKARAAAGKFRPAAVARNTAVRVKGRASDVAEAVRVGRTAMRERETELREQLDDRAPAPDPQLRAVSSEVVDELDETSAAFVESGRRGRAGPRRRARR